MAQRTLFAGAAVKLFARGVDGYNAEIAKLLERWRAFQEPGADATPEEVAAATDARQELRAELRRRQQAREAELDDCADQVTCMLAEGSPTSR